MKTPLPRHFESRIQLAAAVLCTGHSLLFLRRVYMNANRSRAPEKVIIELSHAPYAAGRAYSLCRLYWPTPQHRTHRHSMMYPNTYKKVFVYLGCCYVIEITSILSRDPKAKLIKLMQARKTREGDHFDAKKSKSKRVEKKVNRPAYSMYYHLRCAKLNARAFREFDARRATTLVNEGQRGETRRAKKAKNGKPNPVSAVGVGRDCKAHSKRKKVERRVATSSSSVHCIRRLFLTTRTDETRWGQLESSYVATSASGIGLCTNSKIGVLDKGERRNAVYIREPGIRMRAAAASYFIVVDERDDNSTQRHTEESGIVRPRGGCLHIMIFFGERISAAHAYLHFPSHYLFECRALYSENVGDIQYEMHGIHGRRNERHPSYLLGGTERNKRLNIAATVRLHYSNCSRKCDWLIFIFASTARGLDPSICRNLSDLRGQISRSGL
ncbi:unnamed protein product [Trichogramma brassicae]|uniref:Uncharacterized protein n=1 Tax=Trichogramma brassicae TaxID=86971 RepID=A0A6H5IEI2_9HYME|nr:unnamed protein product [Trichogramma brassicae]